MLYSNFWHFRLQSYHFCYMLSDAILITCNIISLSLLCIFSIESLMSFFEVWWNCWNFLESYMLLFSSLNLASLCLSFPLDFQSPCCKESESLYLALWKLWGNRLEVVLFFPWLSSLHDKKQCEIWWLELLLSCYSGDGDLDSLI